MKSIVSAEVCAIQLVGKGGGGVSEVFGGAGEEEE